jgi:S1-C subfamily serine protease
MKIGTGFFVSPDGQLITNFHVINEASSLVAFDSQGARLSLGRMVSEYNPFIHLALWKFQVKDVPFLR